MSLSFYRGYILIFRRLNLIFWLVMVVFPPWEMYILVCFELLLSLPPLLSFLAKIILHLLLVSNIAMVFVEVVIPPLIIEVEAVVVLLLQLLPVIEDVEVIHLVVEVLVVDVVFFIAPIVQGTIILWIDVMIFMVSRGRLLLILPCSLIILLALIRKLIILLHLP